MKLISINDIKSGDCFSMNYRSNGPYVFNVCLVVTKKSIKVLRVERITGNSRIDTMIKADYKKQDKFHHFNLVNTGDCFLPKETLTNI